MSGKDTHRTASQEAAATQRTCQAPSLGRHLETTGERFPDLLSKVVDFQAQVAELERGIKFSINANDDIDSDFPF